MTVEYFHERGEKIDFVCKVLGLNRSSYYKWKNRTQPKKELQDQEICELIKEYHETYKHILGYRRMTLYINHFNPTCWATDGWAQPCTAACRLRKS